MSDPTAQAATHERPTVSVIMNCLNGEAYLREAIDSVYAQTCTDWEIIFWDNASTDRSAEIAKSYDARLRYFRGEQTVPLGAARNKALEQARGRFIAFLDCDDLWLPEKLEKQLSLFENPRTGLVYSDVLMFNASDDERRLYGITKPCVGDCFASLLITYSLCLSSVMVRAMAISNEPLAFDPVFDIVEEADLFLRISYRWRLDYAPDILAKYRVHKDSGTWMKTALMFQESQRMIEKLERTLPDLDAGHMAAFDRAKRKNAIRMSLLNWQENRKHEARAILRAQVGRSTQGTLLFLLTLIPGVWIVSVLRKLKGQIQPT